MTVPQKPILMARSRELADEENFEGLDRSLSIAEGAGERAAPKSLLSAATGGVIAIVAGLYSLAQQ